MTSNAQFIPVILPDENLTYKGLQIPGLGHAGFILVDPSGNATYYEYGLGYTGTYVAAQNSNTNLGSVRAVPLGVLTFGSNGAVTEASLKSALDVPFLFS